MPRTQSADMFLANKFHLLDVSVSLPPVLLPAFSFSHITAPELVIEEQSIVEGNFEFPRKILKKASVNNIVLSRGTQLQDTDFYSWISNYLLGKREKKNLLLVQSTGISESTFNPPQNSLVAKAKAIPLIGSIVGGVASQIQSTASMFQFGLKTPGRAWVLRNCSPVRYKTASDFDAMSSAVSIQELELSYEWFTEFNTGLLAN